MKISTMLMLLCIPTNLTCMHRIINEQQRQQNADTIIAQALSRLPQNRLMNPKKQKDFTYRLKKMPTVLQHKIAVMAVGDQMGKLVNDHLDELIPCIVPKQKKHPVTQKLMMQSQAKLNKYYPRLKSMYQRLQRENNNQPFIIATCGLWSFDDEETKFRFKHNQYNFAATNLEQWFTEQYGPDTQVNKLQNNEYVHALYSDGTIKTHTSALNTARLKVLSHQQLILCCSLAKQLINSIDKSTDIALYHSLPAPIVNALQSNVSIATSKNEAILQKFEKKHNIRLMTLLAVSTLCTNELILFLQSKNPDNPSIAFLPMLTLFCGLTILGLDLNLYDHAEGKNTIQYRIRSEKEAHEKVWTTIGTTFITGLIHILWHLGDT